MKRRSHKSAEEKLRLRAIHARNNQLRRGRRSTKRTQTPRVEVRNVPKLSVSAIADGGFTYNMVTDRSPIRGFAVSPYKGREKVIDLKSISKDDRASILAQEMKKYVKSNNDLLGKRDHYMGGWLDTESGKYYLDVSVVEQNRDKAMKLAKQHKQLAVFDLGSFKTIYTNPKRSDKWGKEKYGKSDSS